MMNIKEIHEANKNDFLAPLTGSGNTHEEEHQRDQELRYAQLEQSQATVESAINYIYGEKYAYPRDENERGFNRGMDMAIKVIEDNFTI